MDNSITPVMPVGEGFGGGGIWLFALLILFALFNGGGFGGNGNLDQDINRGFADQNIQAQTRDILSTVTSGTSQTIAASTANATNAINAIKDGNAALIREFGNVETALTAMGGQMQNCCCDTLRAIDGVNYNGAINTASINANTTAAVQKVLDAISANKIEALQSQIQQLQLAQATSGVLRFPNSWTYAAGTFPPLTVA